LKNNLIEDFLQGCLMPNESTQRKDISSDHILVDDTDYSNTYRGCLVLSIQVVLFVMCCLCLCAGTYGFVYLVVQDHNKIEK